MSNTPDILPPDQEETLDWINEQRIAGEASDFDLAVLDKLQQLVEDYFHT